MVAGKESKGEGKEATRPPGGKPKQRAVGIDWVQKNRARMCKKSVAWV
jgi:hypothetical protein